MATAYFHSSHNFNIYPLAISVGVGIIQVVLSLKSFMEREKTNINFRVAGSIALVIFWLTLEIILNDAYYNANIYSETKNNLQNLGLITLSSSIIAIGNVIILCHIVMIIIGISRRKY
jgi:hypothetical protein